MSRVKGAKNFLPTKKAVNIYLPIKLYNYVNKKKNKSAYIRNLVEVDYNKNN